MFEIAFLGTSAAAPTIHRGLTSQMVLAGEHRFLIDCGEGTQRQILKSGLGFKRLTKILLTHAHLDHILGLGGLISTLARWEELPCIEIWGSEHTLERVHSLIYQVVFPAQEAPIPIYLHPLREGTFFEDKKFTISAFPVRHQGPGNFGFLFQEKSHHPFLADKAAALGVPNNALRARLVAGESITLEDGRLVQPHEVLGEVQQGVKFVYVGDCGSTDSLRQVAADADCLVIEATYLDEEKDIAQHFGHMTAHAAARFAREAGVKTLLLNHISRRSREYEIRQEAQSVFPETHIVRDFDQFAIVKGKPVVKMRVQAEEED